jgi:hypothetical protein
VSMGMGLGMGVLLVLASRQGYHDKDSRDCLDLSDEDRGKGAWFCQIMQGHLPNEESLSGSTNLS